MTPWQLIKRNLRYYRRTNLTVVAGVAVAVGVLVGSLLIGDSARGSLRHLALERLGKVDYVLRRDRFFREELADGLAGSKSLANVMDICTPAIILEGTARPQGPGEDAVVIPNVSVIGIRDDFWSLGLGGERIKLSGREAVINEHLAAELGVGVGDSILLTVPRPDDAPTDSIYVRKKRMDTVRTPRVVVKAIIPDVGLGRFTLSSDRPRPRNVYVSLKTLQKEMHRPGKVNTLLISRSADTDDDLQSLLTDALLPLLRLEDYGLLLMNSTAENSKDHYLKSTRLVLSPSVVKKASEAAETARFSRRRYSVYLADTMLPANRKSERLPLPYSLVAGMDRMNLAGYRTKDGTPLTRAPRSGEVVLNRWAATDLKVDRGGKISITYLVATETGELEKTTDTMVVSDIVEMVPGDAIDKDFVPDLEGMTDLDRLGKWKPPFPHKQKIRTEDDVYWDDYGPTPKAFVSLDTVRRLWQVAGVPEESSAWVTALRLTPVDSDASESRFKSELLGRLSPSNAGLFVRPVKEEALAVAESPTDFAMLFVSLSFFLVASAAGLIWLLFRLTVDRRAGQIGILLAHGFSRRFAVHILFGEGCVLALMGLVCGIPLGILYAWGILAALATTWAGAIASFPLELHITWSSLIIGGISGLLVSLCAILLSTRIVGRFTALVLLGGWRAIAASSAGGGPALRGLGVALLAGAAVLIVGASVTDAVPVVLAFGLGGGMLLLSSLFLFAATLRMRKSGRADSRRLSLVRLALRGMSRNLARSLLTVGLVACATLLIVTVATFRKDPALTHPGPRTGGTGGFNLLLRSDVPIRADLNSKAGRDDLGFGGSAAKALDTAKFYGFRASSGNDISCLNLQRVEAPRVLGVPPDMISRGGFSFSATIKGDSQSTNPWELLNSTQPSGAIPAFGDAATVQWQLQKSLGDVVTVPTPDGEEVSLRIVGLLPGSVFAGELLISEGNFRRHFGRDVGHTFFLVECESPDEPAIAKALRSTLGQLGMDVQRTSDVLRTYMSVQNTYLTAFETLGGLGLLLATFGIATVLVRSVIERRSELAMLMALGFTRQKVTGLLVFENGLLLAVGMAIGTTSALVAAAPQLASPAADVNWSSLLVTLAVIVLVGLTTCMVAARRSIGDELLSALRTE